VMVAAAGCEETVEPPPTLADLPPELVRLVVGALDHVDDLARANAACRVLRSAVVHALRTRVDERGHGDALPAALLGSAQTLTEELFAREAVLRGARRHVKLADAGGHRRGNVCAFSAFADCGGLVHTCGEVVLDAEGGSWQPLAIGQAGAADVGTGVPRIVASLSAVIVHALAAGAAHLLAMSEVGAVYACGDNTNGQLGIGSAAGPPRGEFVPVSALDGALIVCIAAGGDSSLALTAAGAVHGWGWNRFGQLGIASEPSMDVVPTPRHVEMAGARVAGMAAGDAHALLLTTAGAVFSCGAGGNGRLGHGDQLDQRVPVRIDALAGVRVVHVSAGTAHSLVVDDAGNVRSFGHALGGCLGHGDELRHVVPARIRALEGVRAVRSSAANYVSAVIDAHGGVYTFGRDWSSQLGHYEYNSRSAPGRALPARVHALAPWRIVDAAFGDDHALFVSAEGDAHACGTVSAALGVGRRRQRDEVGLLMRVSLPILPVELGSRRLPVLSRLWLGS